METLSPLEGLSFIMEEMASGNAKTKENRKDVFNITVGDTEIDTCVAGDTDQWETGIAQHKGNWVIVEQYEDRDKAQKGHKKWIKTLTKNPDIELEDINLWNL